MPRGKYKRKGTTAAVGAGALTEKHREEGRIDILHSMALALMQEAGDEFAAGHDDLASFARALGVRYGLEAEARSHLLIDTNHPSFAARKSLKPTRKKVTHKTAAAKRANESDRGDSEQTGA